LSSELPKARIADERHSVVRAVKERSLQKHEPHDLVLFFHLPMQLRPNYFSPLALDTHPMPRLTRLESEGLVEYSEIFDMALRLWQTRKFVALFTATLLDDARDSTRSSRSSARRAKAFWRLETGTKICTVR